MKLFYNILILFIFFININFGQISFKLDISDKNLISFLTQHIDKPANQLMIDLAKNNYFYTRMYYDGATRSNIVGCQFFYNDSVMIVVYFRNEIPTKIEYNNPKF